MYLNQTSPSDPPEGELVDAVIFLIPLAELATLLAPTVPKTVIPVESTDNLVTPPALKLAPVETISA